MRPVTASSPCARTSRRSTAEAGAPDQCSLSGSPSWIRDSLVGGLARGALHEVAGGGNGAIDGAAAVLFSAGIAARTRGKVLWCITRPDLFAPALAQAGLRRIA